MGKGYLPCMVIWGTEWGFLYTLHTKYCIDRNGGDYYYTRHQYDW